MGGRKFKEEERIGREMRIGRERLNEEKERLLRKGEKKGQKNLERDGDRSEKGRVEDKM